MASAITTQTSIGTSAQISTEAPVMVAMREIHKGIASTRDSLTFETNPNVLGDALCELAGLQCELDALRLQLVDQGRSNGVPQTEQVRTMGQYLAARTNNTAAGINIDTAMIRWLRDYPLFTAALAERDMTLAHLRYIKRHLSSSRTFDNLREDQRRFVDNARELAFAGFTKACDYWLVHIDPDGEEPKDQLMKCGLRMRSGLGGRGKVELDLDAISYKAFRTAIDHETEKVRKRQAELEDAGMPGSGIAGSGIAQHRLAALLRLTARGFEREDGTHPVPLINVVMSPQVAEWAHQQIHGANHDDVPVDANDVDGRCELIDGTPVHPLLAIAISGLWNLDPPELRRYVMSAKSRVVDYSYRVRVAPEHLRTASHIEHRGACGTTGCEAPHQWLQADHIHPYSKGGKTRLRNIQPQCSGDNQAKTNTTGHTARRDHRPRARRRLTRDGDSDSDSDSSC